MGIEDRDYYRDHHANKNGMRYNRKNATYSNAEKLFSDAVRPVTTISKISTVRIPKMHPVLIVLLTASIFLAVFLLLKLISKFA